MKIALAQQNYHIGNFEKNLQKSSAPFIWQKNRVPISIMFTELCVCGYPPRDFVEFNDFMNKCYAAVDIIKEHADTIAVIVGSPERNITPAGKRSVQCCLVPIRKTSKSHRPENLFAYL